MRFPLSIVADFLEDEGFEVAARPANLNATFSWVSTLTTPEGRSDGGTLVVASFYSDVPASCPAVLVCAGAASTDRDDVFLLANTWAQPGVVAEKIQAYLLSIYEWIEDMHHMLARHCTCIDLLKRAEPLLKNYISVTDSTFSYIAHTPGIEPIEDASRYLVEHGRYSQELVDTVRKTGMSETWASLMTTKVYESNPIDPCPSIEHVYHLNNQYAAHLVMVCPKSITKGQEFLFELLVEPIGTVLSSDWAISNPLKQPYSTFISNLLHEDSSNRKVTYQQAQLLGIPTNGLFKVCVIDETWRGGSSARFAVRVTAQIPECKVVVDGNRLVVLLCVGEGTGKRLLSNLEERVFDLVASLGTQVGVSRKFFDLMGLSCAFDEAQVALQYGKLHFKDFMAPGERYEGNPKTYIYRFKRYAPYYACDPDIDKNPMLRKRNLAREILGRIEQADVDGGTHDAKILQTYLYSGCKVNAACELLGMHRNSVTYRLKHIEKTYDLDLNDPDERVFLSTLCLMPR